MKRYENFEILFFLIINTNEMAANINPCKDCIYSLKYFIYTCIVFTPTACVNASFVTIILIVLVSVDISTLTLVTASMNAV